MIHYLVWEILPTLAGGLIGGLIVMAWAWWRS